MKIDNHISELLYHHDCVIVTDLGGFIAHYHPAFINSALNAISPPSKKLAFNGSLKKNDGLLANHLSAKEAINYNEACKVIQQYVTDALERIRKGEKLKIDKVGVLFLDRDKNIQFLPDPQVNYLIESFGMNPVHAPVIKRTVPVVEKEEESPMIHDNETVRKSTGRVFKFKVLEVIPAAAVLTFLLLVPPVLNDFNSNLGTMLPFSRMNEFVDELKGANKSGIPIKIDYPSPFEIPPAYLNKTENVINSDAATGDLISELESTEINKAEEVIIPEPTAIVHPVEIKNSVPEASISSFHIIGGSFRLYENAEKLVAEMKMKNYDAAIIGQNKAGLYLVSLFSSNSVEQVNDALPEIKSDVIQSAWVYRK